MCVQYILNDEFKFLSIYMYFSYRKSEYFDLTLLIYEFIDESIGHNYEFNLRLLYT